MGNYLPTFFQSRELAVERKVVQSPTEREDIHPERSVDAQWLDYLHGWAAIDSRRPEIQRYIDLMDRLKADSENASLKLTYEQFMERYGELDGMLYSLGSTAFHVVASNFLTRNVRNESIQVTIEK